MTWADLRSQILTLLDVNPEATTASDIRNAVDSRIYQVRDKLYNLRPPSSLIVFSSPITVDASTEYLLVTGASTLTTPSFVLTDYLRMVSLTISQLADDESREWRFVPWLEWIRSNTAVFGNVRPYQSFTVAMGNRIYLRSVPSGTDTWTATLHYMKSAALVTDGGTPELEPHHLELFVLDVILGFPNLFRGEERAALYASYASKQRELMMLFKNDSDVMMKRRARMTLQVDVEPDSSTFWGTGEYS